MSLHVLFLKSRRTRIVCVKAFVQTRSLVFKHRVLQVIDPRLIDDTKEVSTDLHPRVVDMATNVYL